MEKYFDIKMKEYIGRMEGEAEEVVHKKYQKDGFAFVDTEGRIHTFDMMRDGNNRIMLDEKYHLIVKGDDLLGELRWRLARLEKVVLILGISVLALAASVLLIVL